MVGNSMLSLKPLQAEPSNSKEESTSDSKLDGKRVHSVSRAKEAAEKAEKDEQF